MKTHLKKILFYCVAVLSLIDIQQVSATPIQWSSTDGGNDHWYEVIVAGGGVTWEQAVSLSAGKSYNGQQGYLLTIASQGEQDFIISWTGTPVNLWLGATDSAQEGVWKWVTGPEAGQTLGYTNWDTGEPGSGGDYLAIRLDGVWHATWDGFTDKSVIVEYGTGPGMVPLPPSIWLFGSGLIGLVLQGRNRFHKFQ